MRRLRPVQRFEGVALVVLYLELLEKLEIFPPERFARMVSYLVPDVGDHALQLRVAIGKCTETLLPTKAAHHPPILVDMVGRAGLDVPNKVRQSDVWFEPTENLRVIGHAVDGDELLALTGHDARDVLVQFLLAFRAD